MYKNEKYEHLGFKKERNQRKHKLLSLIGFKEEIGPKEDSDTQVKVKSLSCVRLFAAPWTIAYQAPPSMGFSRQEYRSGLPFPSPEDLPDPGIELGSLAFQADALSAEPPGKPQHTGRIR